MRAIIALAVSATWFALVAATPARALLIQVLPPAQTVVDGATVEIKLAPSPVSATSARRPSRPSTST